MAVTAAGPTEPSDDAPRPGKEGLDGSETAQLATTAAAVTAATAAAPRYRRPRRGTGTPVAGAADAEGMRAPGTGLTGTGGYPAGSGAA
ncbi:hypothetical protein [Streptomyces sp. NPDC002540]